jgi:ATP-binding protein involved in chromosome partitioning
MAQQQHARGEPPGDRRAMMEAQDAEIRERLKNFKHKLLVMSGKGGVGKSTVAAYLSVGLARKGFRVGLMDVDLHGPSIPRLLGLKGNILSSPEGNKAIPLQYMPNLEVMSIETLLGDKDAATIWRGPLKIGVIKQFIADIAWTNADYLIIDSPPGTGDEPLTIAQVIPDTKAIIVTTPQEISLADVRKSINFCRQVHMDILGLVENGSGLTCPHCGKTIDLYKTNGGMLTAKKAGLRLLGSLPLEPDIVTEGDNGTVEWMDKKDMPYTIGFNKIIDMVAELTK